MCNAVTKGMSHSFRWALPSGVHAIAPPSLSTSSSSGPPGLTGVKLLANGPSDHTSSQKSPNPGFSFFDFCPLALSASLRLCWEPRSRLRLLGASFVHTVCSWAGGVCPSPERFSLLGFFATYQLEHHRAASFLSPQGPWFRIFLPSWCMVATCPWNVFQSYPTGQGMEADGQQ